jgi:hypothetical protein
MSRDTVSMSREQNNAVSAVIEMVKCGCKGECKYKGNCSCANNGLASTPLCKCYSEVCSNQKEYHMDEEDDEEEGDNDE